MDNSCPNCSQLYRVKLHPSHSFKTNLPLILSCGHSMCENCIKNIIRFLEPIECKACRSDMKVNAEDITLLNENKIKLFDIFPVNVYMLGEMTLQYLQYPHQNVPRPHGEHFINLLSIMQDQSAKGECLECHKPTTKMCQQCDTILCDVCFNKTHKNFVIFKNHKLTLIEATKETNMCQTHTNKILEYYCKDCDKSICMDCFLVGGEKSCKQHDVVSIQEVNKALVQELTEISPKVNDIFKRLTKTAVDVGHMLYNMDNDTGNQSDFQIMLADVEQHFSKLCFFVQKHKNQVTDIVHRLKSAEKESLFNVKTDIFNALKKTKQIIESINLMMQKSDLKQINAPAILNAAKEAVETPWCLYKDEGKKEPLKIVVNDDLCGLITDYIHLEGNVISIYKLRSTSEMGDMELPPVPPAPVYPPEMTRDVRQVKKEEPKKMILHKFAPNYRVKSSSVTSVNSCGSDKSDRSYIQTGDPYPRPVIQEVQPFEESQSRQLHEGSQELIYITHIINPHNFYVQRACHQDLVKALLREFRNAVSLPMPSVHHVTEGKTYLAFNKADNMWQRCRVMSINKKDPYKPMYQVVCFDFGSTEIVNIDQLRLIPPARLQSPPPLAINCALANCEPITGVWNTEDSFLMQNIIDNKQAIIYVRRIQSNSNFHVKFECDLTTFEDNINIAQALVFHERVRMIDSRIKFWSAPGIREKQKIYMSNDDFKPKSTENVIITHIYSPDKFYVRKAHLQSVYEKLCEDLDAELDINDQTNMIYLPEIDMACAAYVEATETARGGWARAVVRGLEARGRVRLQLVDSGRAAAAPPARLRRLPHRAATLSALATECHLSGVSPLQSRWSRAAAGLLRALAGGELRARVEEARSRGSVGLALYTGPERGALCLNREMIKHKYAVSFGLYSFDDEEEEERAITNECPLEKEKRAARPKPAAVRVLRRDDDEQEQHLEVKDKGPLRLEATILNYQSPSLIYISLVHQQKTFKELFEKMQKFYAKQNFEEKSEWKVGDKCCTICLGSKTWRRANIIEIENQKAKVFYVDFACVETLPITSLMELTPEFASIGNAAIKCHLSGVMPAIGQEWPSISKEYLKELLDAYNRIFITKTGNFKDLSMPVEIWVYHTIHGGALEPNRSEWRCLNLKIVEQGLGIPDRSNNTTEEAAADNPENQDDNEILSFLNVTGSVHEWLQLEPLPIKPIHASSEKEGSSQCSTPNERDSDASNIVFISDWLPAEPLSNKEFTAQPTYIDDSGIIYLHDIVQDDTLELIRKAMDARFKGPDVKAKYVKWSVGEPCVAQFYLDHRFYRGRVVRVNQEELTCIVHYIDFGNDEVCPFESMRKSIALHQIPVQASKCVLDRIRPIHKEWDRMTLDYIHKTVVEKKCLVKVSGEPKNGITPIELFYKKLCINTHLVEFEMAIYSDGSKPLKKVFASSSKQNKSVTESDSGPDYIIENEDESCDPHSTQETFDTSSLQGRDWNKMMDEEKDDISSDNDDNAPVILTYPSNTYDDEFHCNIYVINNKDTFELNIIPDDETDLVYKQMYDEIQAESNDRPPLDPARMYPNKPCVALFTEDMQWYRASILQYAESTGIIKVKYVDYGNVGNIPITEAREIDEAWLKLPPASVSAKLNGVKLKEDVDIDTLTAEFSSTFLEKGPFKVDIVKNAPILLVELKDISGDLVYEELIEKGIFLKDSTEATSE